jgi:hypothetical protein
MAFVPASSLPPSSVAILGAVDVSDRAARLVGHVTVDNASLAVTGPLTAADLLAAEPLSVTGPLTDAQFAAHLPLPVSATIDTAGLATEDTLERVADTLDDVGLTAILQREEVSYD